MNDNKSLSPIKTILDFLPFSLTGLCGVSKESIIHLMTKQGSGNAAVIVVGGANEALNARPGSYKLMLRNRKGFIKIAIQTGYVNELDII